MKNVSWRFQNLSMILSASVRSQYMGLWHGIVCQRKLGYAMKLKHSSKIFLLNLWMILLLQFDFENFLWRYINPVNLNLNLIRMKIHMTCYSRVIQITCISSICFSNTFQIRPVTQSKKLHSANTQYRNPEMLRRNKSVLDCTSRKTITLGIRLNVYCFRTHWYRRISIWVMHIQNAKWALHIHMNENIQAFHL